METTILDGDRLIPTEPVLIVSMWGRGRLVYLTRDGWAGVQLDGECTVHEYPGEHVHALPAVAQ